MSPGTARHMASTSMRGAMRPSRWASRMSRSARRSLSDEIGNATSATSIPISPSSAASSTFCSGEKATPGICSPSRKVSS